MKYEIDQEFQTGQLLRGQYRILGSAHGGMGTVYFCHHEATNQTVCLKTVRQDFLTSKHAQDLFNQEIRVWFELGTHINIAKALDCFHVGTRLFVLTEYVPGVPGIGSTLAHHLSKHSFSLPQCLYITLQICDGMNYAHQKAGVIHRDLKPSNILVGYDLNVLITDFGLARAKGGGTLGYMAPELFDNTSDRASPASDVYATGVCLYQMLSGYLPFDPINPGGNQFHSYGRAHADFTIKELPSRIPLRLRQIVLGCLAEEPSYRYQSFESLLADLRQVCTQEGWSSLTPGDVQRTNSDPKQRSTETEAVDLMRFASALEELGQFSEAMEALEKSMSLAPANSWAWSSISRIFLKQARYDQAISSADRAISIDPQSIDALLNKGSAQNHLQRHQDALLTIQRAAELNPNNADVWRNLALVTKSAEEKLAYLDRALSVDPMNVESLAYKVDVEADLRHFDEALALVKRIDAIDPTYSDRTPLTARILLHRGDVNEARGLIAQWLAKHLGEASAFARAASLYSSFGVIEDATSLYKLATEMDPFNYTLWYDRGTQLVNNEKYEEAINCFEQALKLEKHDSQLLFNMGNALGKSGRVEEAIEYFDLCIEIDPEIPSAWYNRGVLTARTSAASALPFLFEAERLGYPGVRDIREKIERLLGTS